MTASDLLAILPYLLVGEIFVKIITRVKHNRVRVKPQMSNVSAISWWEQLTFDEMIMMYETNTLLFDFYSASSLKQQSAGRHVYSLGNILILSLGSFSLMLCAWLLSKKYHFIVFLLTWPRLKPMINRTCGKHANDYTTNPVTLIGKATHIQGQWFIGDFTISIGRWNFRKNYNPSKAQQSEE
jgi:hypothetical protein